MDVRGLDDDDDDDPLSLGGGMVVSPNVNGLFLNEDDVGVDLP